MNQRISRRRLLGSAAVMLSLPFLPSLEVRSARAQTCSVPKRFAAWFVPNGIVMPNWTPTATGTDWAPTPILAPFETVRKKMLVLSGLDHHATAEPRTPPNGHASGTGCFLNMIPVSQNENNTQRTSVDQLLLPALYPEGCNTSLPSLQIGIQGPNGLCDQGPCIFSRAISWDKGTPLPYIADPQQAFDRMFSGVDLSASKEDAARRLAVRVSVIDRVLAQANSLKRQLSSSDQVKLDQYLTGVRELEQRVQNQPAALACTVPGRPEASPPLNFDRGITPSSIIESHMPVFLDLMALAFECDITRSLTFMLGNGTSNNNYEFVVGTSTPHHGTSHHQGNAANLDKLTKIDIWEMQQAAALLERLDKTIEADGKSILDHTTFYLSSDISDGNTHNKWDMPVVVAGGGSVRADGRHINYATDMTFPRPLVGPRSDTHTGRVLTSIMHGHGIAGDTLGEAKGVLEDILVA
jgi:Protein of unknown function (DUF1552)